MHGPASQPGRATSAATRPVGILVGLSVAFAVVVGLFGWSLTAAGHAPALHGVKVAVVGPPAGVASLRDGLARGAPGAITAISSPSLTSALEAVRDRSVYAAVTLAPAHLYVASAAGPAVSTALVGVFQHALRAVAVTDVRPVAAGDPRGLTVLYVVVSTVIGSVAFSVVRFILFPRSPLPVLAASGVAFAVLAGVAEAVAVVVVVGALGGSFGPVVLGAALLSLAVTTFTAGLMAVLGLAGAGVAALVVVIAGNASSGGATAPELVDGFWRHVGPYIPPGAGTTLIRNLVYFDGNATTGALLVLLGYVVAGVALTVAARSRVSDPLRTPAGSRA